MIILVPSVHHTGTKLVHNELLKGWPQINQQDHTEHSCGRIRIHLDEPFLEDVKYWLQRVPAIVPLRHPRKVALGWKRRHKLLTRLGEQWKALKEIVDPYGPYYLPIDHEDRDAWLKKIERGLGLKFVTDWPVVGSSAAPEEALTDQDEFLLDSWMKDGFFARFDYEHN